MITKPQFKFIFRLLIVSMMVFYVLVACIPITPAITSTPYIATPPQVNLDLNKLATSLQTKIVPAVSASDNSPYWDLLPEYTKVTLHGYPINTHLMEPQIYIYTVKELGKVNEGAGKIAASLQTLLDSPQEIASMPFMPMLNAAQVMHTNVQYFDFKNGKGLRYLTQFDQAFIPINNHELIYTYQGLTNDGKYYVAAVLPVNHPSLPADGNVTGKELPEFTSNFHAYLTKVVNSLNLEPANTFTPDLFQLDAMISSLELK